MATTYSYVQGAPDSTGKKVATSEVTDAAGNVVERQQIVGSDPLLPGNLQQVSIDGEAWVGGPPLIDLLTAIVVELRVNSYYLQMIANSRDEPDALRADLSLQP